MMQKPSSPDVGDRTAGSPGIAEVTSEDSFNQFGWALGAEAAMNRASSRGVWPNGDSVTALTAVSGRGSPSAPAMSWALGAEAIGRAAGIVDSVGQWQSTAQRRSDGRGKATEPWARVGL